MSWYPDSERKIEAAVLNMKINKASVGKGCTIFLFFLVWGHSPFCPPSMSLNETGTVTICTGMVVLLLGSFFLFDKALVIAGNLLVIVGFALILRANALSLLRFEKLQGTAFFVLGIALLLLKYTLLGVLLEAVGLLMIFKGSLPSFNNVLYSFLFRKPRLPNK